MKTPARTIAQIVKELKSGTVEQNYTEALSNAIAELAITMLEITQAAKKLALENLFDDYQRYGTIQSEYTINLDKVAKNHFGKDSADQIIKGAVLRSFKGLWFGTFEEVQNRSKWEQYEKVTSLMMSGGIKEPASIKAVWDAFSHALYIIEQVKKDEQMGMQLVSGKLLMDIAKVYRQRLSKIPVAHIQSIFSSDELEEQQGVKLEPVYEKADRVTMKEFISSMTFKVKLI